MKKKLLSMVLAAAMVFTMGAATAFAADQNIQNSKFSITNLVKEDGTAQFAKPIKGETATDKPKTENEAVSVYVVSSGAVLTLASDTKYFDYGTAKASDNAAVIDKSQSGDVTAKDVKNNAAAKGATLTFSKDGLYYVIFDDKASDKAVLSDPQALLVDVGGNHMTGIKATPAPTTDTKDKETDANKTTTPAVTAPTTPTAPAASETVTALYTTANVVVNGKDVKFEAYNIGGNNYFKLRDIAKAINGTEKQFSVTWDEPNKAIKLAATTAYTEVGGELVAGDGTNKTGILSKSPIYKDGFMLTLTAYNINGNNYFQLREIGKTFNFGVDYTEATKTITIDTTKGYSLAQ